MPRPPLTAIIPLLSLTIWRSPIGASQRKTVFPITPTTRAKACKTKGGQDYEAQRIVAEMKRQYSPNSPNKTHYMTELAPAFLMLASSRDVDRLFSLLPYKTLTFSKIEGRHGIYALIDKNENRDRDIRKPRPSIRAQLAADKKKAAPKRAAKTKHHEMEV